MGSKYVLVYLIQQVTNLLMFVFFMEKKLSTPQWNNNF